MWATRKNLADLTGEQETSVMAIADPDWLLMQSVAITSSWWITVPVAC